MLHWLATQSSNLPECNCTRQSFPFSISDAVNPCGAACTKRELHGAVKTEPALDVLVRTLPVSTGGAFNKSTLTPGICTKTARLNLLELYMHFKWLNT